MATSDSCGKIPHLNEVKGPGRRVSLAIKRPVMEPPRSGSPQLKLPSGQAGGDGCMGTMPGEKRKKASQGNAAVSEGADQGNAAASEGADQGNDVTSEAPGDGKSTKSTEQSVARTLLQNRVPKLRRARIKENELELRSQSGKEAVGTGKEGSQNAGEDQTVSKAVQPVNVVVAEETPTPETGDDSSEATNSQKDATNSVSGKRVLGRVSRGGRGRGDIWKNPSGWVVRGGQGSPTVRGRGRMRGRGSL
eukprot:TRINITY_DN3944_c1_g1_i9.p1 TRINITY_DN3944_c1_g1~~TRINITY_DN3944_c1_g1_i9.p1  ORF type:complete len:279 (+),score=50.40 TRINITY_DN3944_c1_g1_i9:91-837(+)